MRVRLLKLSIVGKLLPWYGENDCLHIQVCSSRAVLTDLFGGTRLIITSISPQANRPRSIDNFRLIHMTRKEIPTFFCDRKYRHCGQEIRRIIK